MPKPKHPTLPVRIPWRRILVLLLLVLLVVGLYNAYRPLPDGLNFQGAAMPVTEVRFLVDKTYTDDQGYRHLEQTIFDQAFELIDGARRFVLVDMFLFNDFQGEIPENHRALSSELTEKLIRQKRRYPDMQVLVITDPLNTLYGGLASHQLAQLEAAGVSVTLTKLSKLRDSNPLYSSIWRLFIQPWGNSPGGILPSPFGPERVSLRSYLSLLNFKANHRKVLIADQGEEFAALVTSANPHDGSSAHGNVALSFSGPAVADLLATERAVLAFSGGPEPAISIPRKVENIETPLSLQVLTERAVEQALLSSIDLARSGDRLDLAVFYLSDRHLVKALLRAQERGVRLRVLLDPNKDAFGRTKDGVPNRPVAHELASAGVPVRWCDTQGEQCHAKWLLGRYVDGSARMILGSSNYTRRNLHNLNLETSVLLAGAEQEDPIADASLWFEQRWNNTEGRAYSVDYDVYADSSLSAQLKYRFMEAMGLSTF